MYYYSSQLLQRISSIIITSIEGEFKKHSNVVMSLKGVFDSSKETVKNRLAEEAEEAKKVNPSNGENYESVVSQFSPHKPKSQPYYREDVENCKYLNEFSKNMKFDIFLKFNRRDEILFCSHPLPRNCRPRSRLLAFGSADHYTWLVFLDNK